MRDVLVVGSRGYVGPAVVTLLKEKGYAVGEVDAGWFSDHSMLGAINKSDIRLTGFDETTRWPETIVYLAAVSNDPAGSAYEKATYQINRDAAITLAVEARAAGVRKFVYASSCSVYGTNDGRPCDENHDLDPLTHYANSKVQAERGLAKLASSNFEVTVLRFATACGWSPNLRLDLVLNDFVASALLTKQIQIMSDGSPWRPLIHVQDMARAFLWACESEDQSAFQIVNIGSELFTHQISGLAKSVASLLDATPKFSNEPDRDSRSYIVDFSLFRRLAPGYQPMFKLEDTVIDLSERLSRLDSLNHDYRSSPIYTRLAALTQRVKAGTLQPKTLLPAAS